MRATEYKDGIKRIKAKIEVPLSELDVSNFVTSPEAQQARIVTVSKRRD